MSNENSSTNLPLNPGRERQFWIRTYIEPIHVEKFLKTEPWIHHWATCYHDKDFNEQHLPVTPHSHILLYTYDGKTASAVLKRFDGLSREIYKDNPQQTRCEICFAPVRCYRYLLHLDDIDKHLYSPDELHSDNPLYWKKFEQTDGMNGAHNVALSMFQDMKKGVKTVTMLERYGMNFARMRGNIQNLVEQDYYENRQPNYYNRYDYKNEYVSILKCDTNCPYTNEQIELFRRMFEYAESIKFLNEQESED